MADDVNAEKGHHETHEKGKTGRITIMTGI
jgi:hypothetical protein